MFAALMIQLGLKASHRVYKTQPSFERGHSGPWGPHPWFPAVERRQILVTLDTCPHMYWQLRSKHLNLVSPEPAPAPPAFDWLRDYGPYWFPETFAWWLDPETEEQRAAWFAKYRAPRKPDYLKMGLDRAASYNQYAQYGAQGLASAYANQMQNQYANQALNQYRNRYDLLGLFK